MGWIGSGIRWLLGRGAGERAATQPRGAGPYRTPAHDAPLAVVFEQEDFYCHWAAEDEEGLIVADFRGPARVVGGGLRRLAKARMGDHYALGPRGVVWLEGSSRGTEVRWLANGGAEPRSLAMTGGAPSGSVARVEGVYWGTSDHEMEPGNPKVLLRSNGKIWFVPYDGGPPVQIVHRDADTCPCVVDDAGVAWIEYEGLATIAVYEAAAGRVTRTTQFHLARGEADDWGRATTLGADAVYAYDGEAGGIVAVPRRGGERRLLAPTHLPALALAPADDAVFAVLGDARRTPREIWRVDRVTSAVTVLGRFVAERWPHGAGIGRSKIAVGRAEIFVHGMHRVLRVPRA